MATLRRAIWSGKCVDCGMGILRGDQIFSDKGEGSCHVIRHLRCPGREENRSRREGSASGPPEGGLKTRPPCRAAEHSLARMLDSMNERDAAGALKFLVIARCQGKIPPEVLSRLQAIAGPHA
jgi:hypothetical protein